MTRLVTDEAKLITALVNDFKGDGSLGEWLYSASHQQVYELSLVQELLNCCRQEIIHFHRFFLGGIETHIFFLFGCWQQ